MSIWKRLYAKDTSLPHSALSFFTAKTEEGLKLCIDYRALNQVTTKFWYTLLLITVAFELFRWATELIKLYLRSTYNLSEFERGMSWRLIRPTNIGLCRMVWSGPPPETSDSGCPAESSLGKVPGSLAPSPSCSHISKTASHSLPEFIPPSMYTFLKFHQPSHLLPPQNPVQLMVLFHCSWMMGWCIQSKWFLIVKVGVVNWEEYGSKEKT